MYSSNPKKERSAWLFYYVGKKQEKRIVLAAGKAVG